MKKIITVLICLVLSIQLVGCQSKEETTSIEAMDDLAALEDDDLSDEELAYYSKVMLEITEKLLNVAVAQ